MFEFLKKEKKFLQCGGESFIDIYDGNKKIGKIYYKRPDSDMVLDFTFQSQNIINGDSQLRKLKNSKDLTRDIYKVTVNEVFIPFAEKIFVSCEGFSDENNEDLSVKDTNTQFDYIKKYYHQLLVRLTEIAFEKQLYCKKKA